MSSFSCSVRLVLAVLALPLAGVATTGTLRAQAADVSALEQKFREGCDLYCRQKPEEALKKFQEVLAENPSNEAAFQLYHQAGHDVMALMLVAGGEFETTAKRFLELAALGRKAKSDDAAAISGLVEKAMSGNYLDRRDALHQLSADHGEYGAAPFIEHLSNADDPAVRANAVYCLIALSGDAVLPLVAALDSGNDAIVMTACACLGTIRDARATPALKSVWEKSGNATAKDAANEALKKITGRDAGALGAAADLHADKALEFFRNDQKVAQPFDTQDAVWSWKDGKVTPEKVPAMLRRYRLAAQHCDAALDSPRAQGILLASKAAEKAAVLAAKDMGNADAGEADPRLDVVLASGGPAGLSAGLEVALANHAPRAAVELLKTLESMGAATNEMRGALTSEYKAVRYHAAFALAMSGELSDKVVQSMGEALGEDAMRSVLVIDDRSQSLAEMAAALRAAGYSVITADNGSIGFARARSFPPKDVVVVRANLADVTFDQIVYDADFRSATSAIVAVAAAEEVDGLKSMYAGKGNFKDALAEPVTADALTAAVKAVMPDLNHEREAALAAAERAATMLAHLPAQNLNAIASRLEGALVRTEEPVLTGVLKAVGKVGSTDAAAKVVAIFSDTGRSEVVRVAAADALGGIFSRMASAPAPDVVKAVVDAARTDASAAVRLAAGRALGSAGFLGAAERAEILRG